MVRAIGGDIADELRKVEDNVTQDVSVTQLSGEHRAVAENVYTLLALLCKDEAASYVPTGQGRNGLQAWQALLRAKINRYPRSLTNQLLDPRVSSSDPRVDLCQWKNGNVYQATQSISGTAYPS